MQFVNGMNTSYVQIRNELASEQLIKVQFQVAMSELYSAPNSKKCSKGAQRNRERPRDQIGWIFPLRNIALELHSKLKTFQIDV